MNDADTVLSLLRKLGHDEVLNVIEAVKRQLLLVVPDAFVPYLGEMFCEATTTADLTSRPGEVSLRVEELLQLFIDFQRCARRGCSAIRPAQAELQRERRIRNIH